MKYRNEIQINELDSKYKTLVEEHQQSKDEIAKFKQTIVSLENELHQSVKTAGHLRTKIALVEQEVKSKQEVLQQTNDRIAMEQDSKVRLNFEKNKQEFYFSIEKIRRNSSIKNGENVRIKT